MRKRTAFWVVHQFETLLTTAISYFFADRMIFTAMKIELSLCCLSGWLPPQEWSRDCPSTPLALASDHSP